MGKGPYFCPFLGCKGGVFFFGAGRGFSGSSQDEGEGWRGSKCGDGYGRGVRLGE